MKTALLLLLALGLGGCAELPPNLDRHGLANAIAKHAALKPLSIETDRFLLRGYARVEQPGAPLTIYIEGDGNAWRGQTPSVDPTPLNPLALRLAALDRSVNVIYLARPCQYDRRNCETKDWTSHRMSAEIIDAYERAVHQLLQRFAADGVRLVGFSGGAGIAVLLAARMVASDSLIDLRTVAGNIDHRQWTSSQGLLPLSGSLNPRDYSNAITGVPQLHFMGRQDRVVDGSVFQSYVNAAQTPRCVVGRMYPATHVTGWLELWPKLHRQSVSCQD